MSRVVDEALKAMEATSTGGGTSEDMTATSGKVKFRENSAIKDTAKREISRSKILDIVENLERQQMIEDPSSRIQQFLQESSIATELGKVHKPSLSYGNRSSELSDNLDYPSPNKTTELDDTVKEEEPSHPKSYKEGLMGLFEDGDIIVSSDDQGPFISISDRIH